jgi:hypothetical protein
MEAILDPGLGPATGEIPEYTRHTGRGERTCGFALHLPLIIELKVH